MPKFVVVDWDAGTVGAAICDALGLEANSVKRLILDLDLGSAAKVSAAKVYTESFVDSESVKVELPKAKLEIVE